MLKRIIIILIFIINVLTINVYAKYSFEIVNLAGNINIDKTSPIVEVEYSTKEKNVQNVEVTIHVNENIKDIEGFTQKDNMTYKKIYEKNIKEKVLVQDIYGNISVADIEIDNIMNHPILIKCNNISNSNLMYPKYANKNKIIDLEISTDKKYEVINGIDINKISVFVENEKVECNISIKDTTNNEEVNKYEIEICNILANGNLKVKIDEKSIIDINNNFNLEMYIDTEIIVDNIEPSCTVNEELQEDGMSIIRICANEDIQILNGWNISESKRELTKQFPSNVSYNLVVNDYAGNDKLIEVDVLKATFIKLIYASHNSNVGWTYGYGNYDIAGAKAIEENPNYKTESLAIRIEGSMEEDFLQGQAYVYSYWGQGINARCTDTGHIYSYGYNPSKENWASLKTINDPIYLGDKKYFQLGGCGINKIGQLALTGINPIPMNIGLEFRYGISAIAFKLKNYNNYDVVYQIYEKNNGWINVCKNGEECMKRI